MQFRSILVVVTVLVSGTFLVSDARGQGRVQGEVTDKWGNGLGVVQIAVERTDGGGSYSATTEDDGEYIILGLQSGTYEITFTLDGYQGVRVAENVRSSAGPRLDVELEALASGGRLRGEQDFEAEGGSPKIKFKELVKLMLNEDIKRWTQFLDGKVFPWDAPLYPDESRIITRLSEENIKIRSIKRKNYL